MKQSHQIPAYAKYAELSDIAETLTFIHQSCHQICKNRLFLIQPFQKLFAPHTLITPQFFFCRWDNNQMSFCSSYSIFLPGFALQIWFLKSFLQKFLGEFFSLLSHHPLWLSSHKYTDSGVYCPMPIRQWPEVSDFVACMWNTCDSCMSLCFLTCTMCKKVWHESYTSGHCLMLLAFSFIAINCFLSYFLFWS